MASHGNQESRRVVASGRPDTAALAEQKPSHAASSSTRSRNTSSTQLSSINSSNVGSPSGSAAAPSSPSASALVPAAEQPPQQPNCVFVYPDSKNPGYSRRHDRVGHPDEISKVIFVGLCMGLWWWRILGLVATFALCLLILTTVATLSSKSYEQMTGYTRWIFNKTITWGSRACLIVMGIFRINEHNVSKEEFDRIRERYSEIPVEAEKEMDYPPFYVVANHSSVADPAVCLYVYGPLSVVAKEALKKIPVFGTICQLVQCLFVGGDNQKIVQQLYQREESYINKLRSMETKKKLHRHAPPQMLIFPEGTVTNGKQIIRFHGGAFKNGQAVQPLVIRYPYRNFNMSWVRMGFTFFPYLFGQLYNSCEVYKLPPYIPNQLERSNWRLYAYNVQRVMVDVANMYLHEDEDKFFASDELFFRHGPPTKEKEEDVGVVQGDESIGSDTEQGSEDGEEEDEQSHQESVPPTRTRREHERSHSMAAPRLSNNLRTQNDDLVVVVPSGGSTSHLSRVPATALPSQQQGSTTFQRFRRKKRASAFSSRRSTASSLSERLAAFTNEINDHLSVTGDTPQEFMPRNQSNEEDVSESDATEPESTVADEAETSLKTEEEVSGKQ